MPLYDDYTFENRIDLSGVNRMVNEVKEQIGKIIVGQHDFVELLIVALLSDGHVLIEGVPGIAKTLTAKLLAKTVSTQFSRIQFTPDLMPSDVLGTSVYNFKTSEFDFNKGPVFANIILIDEINRAPAKTQSSLFEVMEERQITIDGQQYKMMPPFIVLATQNPIEHEGTYRLPEAQLDRFLFKIEVGYPNFEEEVLILSNDHQRQNDLRFADINAVVSVPQLLEYRKLVKQVLIDEKLLHYIVGIIHATRNSRDLYLGGSPRASLAIMNGAKAYAAMQGRDFVTPEDIQFLCKPVLRHRLILSPEKEMEGISTDKVIEQILKGIEAPR